MFKKNNIPFFAIKAGLIFGIILCAVHFAYYFSQNYSRPLELVDPDCYRWLVQSELLQDHFSWYPTRLERSNPPEGEATHYWSRWMDLSLLIPAKILGHVVPFKSALLYWGIAYSPLILILLMGLVGWFCGLFFENREDIVVALAFFAVQAGTHAACMAGRPDNHSLLLLLFVAAILAMIISLVNQSAKWAFAAALIVGFSLEISVQTLVLIAEFYALAYVAWTLKLKESFRMARIFIYSVPAVSLFFYLVCRHPSQWLSITLDQLCGIHVVAMLIPCVVIELMYRCNISSAVWRWIMPVVVSVVLTIPFYFVYPYFFNGPFAGIDPDVKRYWFSSIAELLPLVSGHSTKWALIVLAVGPLIPCSIICWDRLLRKDSHEGIRACWIFWLFLLLSHSVLTLLQFRWVYYVGVAFVIPWAMCYQYVRDRYVVLFDQNVFYRAALKICFILFWPIAALCVNQLFANRDLQPQQATSVVASQPFSRLCEWVESRPQWRDKKLNAVCYIDKSMEFLYRTHHSVVGTPYHRNTRGILSNYYLMTSIDDSEVLAIVKEMRVDMIILCIRSDENGGFYNIGNLNKFTLRERLMDGYRPTWLKQVLLPPDLAKDYQIYVTGDIL